MERYLIIKGSYDNDNIDADSGDGEEVSYVIEDKKIINLSDEQNEPLTHYNIYGEECVDNHTLNQIRQIGLDESKSKEDRIEEIKSGNGPLYASQYSAIYDVSEHVKFYTVKRKDISEGDKILKKYMPVAYKKTYIKTFDKKKAEKMLKIKNETGRMRNTEENKGNAYQIVESYIEI